MIAYIERIFKQIDIYGQNIQLSFKKTNTYNTVFGGLISFIVLSSFCVGCWFFGKELYLKQNPSVIIQERSVSNPQRITVKPDNLIIMMGISNNNAQFIHDPSIFTVNAVQLTQVLVQDQFTGKQTIQLANNTKTIKQCAMNDVQIPNLVGYFQSLNYTALYCFDSQNEDVYIEGDFNQKQFSQLLVYFQKCQNSTQSKTICKSQEIIDKTLLLTKLSIFISDHIIDPLNYKDPISDRAITLYASSSSQFPQEATISLANYYIDTDAGALFKDLKQEQTFVFASQQVSPLFGDPTVLMKINIRLQKFKENYMKRQYLKIADVVAQIGGLLKILVIIGALFANPIEKLYYFKAVIDEIYSFESSDKKVLLKQKGQTSLNSNSQSSFLNSKLKNRTQKRVSSENDLKMQIKNETPKAFLKQNTFQTISIDVTQNFNQHQTKKSLNFLNKNTIDQILNKVKDYFQTTHNIIKYTFANYFIHAFIPSCKWKTPDRQLLNQGINKIQENFDIIYIFNKLLEIDKIKSILFNQDQLNLFEYMPKPTISDELQNDIQQNKNNQASINKNKSDPVINNISNQLETKSKQVKKRQKKQELIHKSESDLANQAYEGLFNILNKKKISKIDENLIRTIDPELLQQIQQGQKQEENEQNNFSQILNSNNFIIQLQGNQKKEFDFQNYSTGKNQSKFFQNQQQNEQQSSILDQYQNENQNQVNYQNDPFNNFQNQPDLTSSQFINFNDASNSTKAQPIKKNKKMKSIKYFNTQNIQ